MYIVINGECFKLKNNYQPQWDNALAIFTNERKNHSAATAHTNRGRFETHIHNRMHGIATQSKLYYWIAAFRIYGNCLGQTGYSTDYMVHTSNACIVYTMYIVHPIKTAIAERMKAITFCLCFNPKYSTRYRYPLSWLNASTATERLHVRSKEFFVIFFAFSTSPNNDTYSFFLYSVENISAHILLLLLYRSLSTYAQEKMRRNKSSDIRCLSFFIFPMHELRFIVDSHLKLYANEAMFSTQTAIGDTQINQTHYLFHRDVVVQYYNRASFS